MENTIDKGSDAKTSSSAKKKQSGKASRKRTSEAFRKRIGTKQNQELRDNIARKYGLFDADAAELEKSLTNMSLTIQSYAVPLTVSTRGVGFAATIGPYFFENEVGQAVTVNGVRYRKMITDFLWPEIEDMDLDDMWFQQDGATCHTANETITLLRDKFNDRVISRCGDVNWPPRSCDLTPLDFFLWGYLKEKVYVNKPRTIQELKDEITRRC